MEERAELLADRALLCVAVVPLVGVDAEGGVGFAVAESVLDGGDAVAEMDERGGVAVAEVVQSGVGSHELRVCCGSLEGFTAHLALESISVAALEEEGVGVKRLLCCSASSSRHFMSSLEMSIARRDSAVLSGVRLPSRLSW